MGQGPVQMAQSSPQMQAGPDSPMQRMIVGMMYQRFPKFRELMNSVRGQNPVQAFQERGLDYSQYQNMDVNQVRRMLGF